MKSAVPRCSAERYRKGGKAIMKAYKGFNRDMTCAPKGKAFQYKKGETYHEDEATLCEKGFHACEMPTDVFNYYAPGTSVYHEVDLEDVSAERNEDTKVCGKTIKIGAKLDVAGMVKAQFDYVKSHTTTEDTDPKKANAGDHGAANAGYKGAANAGNYGAANAGNYGAAISRGEAIVGKYGVAVARGDERCKNRAKGKIGSILVIALENEEAFEIKDFAVGIVDGETIKADTWYKLENGQLVEAGEE